MNRQHCLSE